MKRALLAAALLLAFVGVSYAHGGNEHVRGTVTQVSATSITVQTAKKAEAIRLNDKTMFMRSGKHVTMNDLKVGDRVVVDVSGETHIAESVNFGTPPAAAKAGAKPPAHK